jgi:hypothetical protein
VPPRIGPEFETFLSSSPKNFLRVVSVDRLTASEPRPRAKGTGQCIVGERSFDERLRPPSATLFDASITGGVKVTPCLSLSEAIAWVHTTRIRAAAEVSGGQSTPRSLGDGRAQSPPSRRPACLVPRLGRGIDDRLTSIVDSRRERCSRPRGRAFPEGLGS